MAPTTPNPRVVYTKIPDGIFPVVGEHIVYEPDHRISLEVALKKGEFLTKTLILSPEPFIRDRMRDRSVPSYSTTSIIGAPLIGFGLVRVLRSEKEGVKVGDYMLGMTPWEAYTVQPYVEGRVDYKPEEWPSFTTDMDRLALQPVPNPGGAFPLSNFVNALGIPGLTAFYGLEEAATGLKAGDVIYVSAGASGVGSLVIQLAKTKGLKVIASAGSDEKTKYIASLGADVVFNYKTTSYNSVLKEHGPINAYWDNTGGDALAAAIDNASNHAQFLMCGHLVDYNVSDADRYPLKNTIYIFKKCLRLQGFLVSDAQPALIGRFYQEVPGLLAQGKLKSQEFAVHGIENAAQGFVDSLKGDNKSAGKTVIVVADDN